MNKCVLFVVIIVIYLFFYSDVRNTGLDTFEEVPNLIFCKFVFVFYVHARQLKVCHTYHHNKRYDQDCQENQKDLDPQGGRELAHDNLGVLTVDLPLPTFHFFALTHSKKKCCERERESL